VYPLSFSEFLTFNKTEKSYYGTNQKVKNIEFI
jgi:predicted AAA+ superfamily ATPase